MAYITLDKAKLHHNYNFLDSTFKKQDIEWGVVTKLLCGNKEYIKELIGMGITEMHDTRISNLKIIKQLAPHIQTVYIKPPAKRAIKSIVAHADVSFNTEYATIKLLSEEAVAQNKKHKIIIMIEMGDLREGVMGEDLIDFYAEIFKLPNIQIVGLGTNLNCLNGVLPSQDKLVQLSLYTQLIEAKFNRKIPWVSGGTSVTLPMLLKKQLPKAVNHFRLGETLFFGNDLFTNEPIEEMEQDIFLLHTQIIELTEKPKIPTGEMQQNVAGRTTSVNEEDYGKTSYRAILDIGLLDADPQYLTTMDSRVEIVEASSDMLVVDVGDDSGGLKVGDFIQFKPTYMGALGLLNSNYITKTIL